MAPELSLCHRVSLSPSVHQQHVTTFIPLCVLKPSTCHISDIQCIIHSLLCTLRWWITTKLWPLCRFSRLLGRALLSSQKWRFQHVCCGYRSGFFSCVPWWYLLFAVGTALVLLVSSKAPVLLVVLVKGWSGSQMLHSSDCFLPSTWQKPGNGFYFWSFRQESVIYIYWFVAAVAAKTKDEKWQMNLCFNVSDSSVVSLFYTKQNKRAGSFKHSRDWFVR